MGIDRDRLGMDRARIGAAEVTFATREALRKNVSHNGIHVGHAALFSHFPGLLVG